MKVIIHRDKAHLAESAANRIAAEAARAIDERQQQTFSLGLAGGSTPAETYKRLAQASLPWDRIDTWLSDERWVPHDHPDSNGHMAASLLIDQVGARFHRPRWAPWLTSADSASHYETTLRSLHNGRRPDLVLLGMGDDGHTASLFPGTAALDVGPERWYVSNHVPKLDANRLTATYPFIRSAHHVIFLVAGASKADALRQVLEPEPDEKHLPAAGVAGGDAEVTWLVDESAADRIATTPTVVAD